MTKNDLKSSTEAPAARPPIAVVGLSTLCFQGLAPNPSLVG